MDTFIPEVDLDLNDEEAKLDPTKIYASLQERYPIFRLRSGNLALCRHEDVRLALRDWQTFSEGVSTEARGEWWMPEDCRHEVFLISQSPPQHEKYRSLINKNYIPAAINGFIPEIENKISEILIRLPVGHEFDFVELVSLPVASMVSSLATGVEDNPYHSETIRKWAFLSELNAPDSPEAHQQAVIAETRKLNLIFKNLIESRQAQPRTKDLVSLLLRSTVDSKELTYETISGALGLFLSAGFMTSAQLLSATMRQLVARPVIRQQLIEDRSLVPALIEETLRYVGPTHSVMRLTTKPVTLHDAMIPKGARVHLILGAANRDPRQFEHPNDFILGRENIKTHVAFGYGVHVCIGAALARLVSKVVITRILDFGENFNWSLISEEWNSTLYTRGLEILKIRFEK